jgi:DNA polymerase-1
MFSVRDTTSKDLSWINESQYHLVRDAGGLKLLLETVGHAALPGLDCETEGLSHIAHQLVGLSFSPAPGHAFYVPLRHRSFDNLPPALLPPILDLLRRKQWVLFNGAFDRRFIYARLGVDVEVAQDVQADMWLLDSDRGPKERRTKLKLKYLAKELLNIEMLELEDLLPQGVTDFSLVNDEIDALLYAGGDTDCLLRLKTALDPRLDQWKLRDLSRLEARVTAPVAEMEGNGIDIDAKYAASIDLAEDLALIQDKINSLAEATVNPNSPDQVAALLYDKLKILQPGKEGSRSTDEKVLSRHKDRHPVIPLILDFREIDKLKSSFIDKLREVAAEDGRLHGNFISTGTRSSRFAASGGFGRGGINININSQTFPKTTRVNCRKILRASTGFYWVSADFGQIEYRGVAYISQDKGLLDAYAHGIDMHTKTYVLLKGGDVHNISDKQRSYGKTMNFALVFGMTDMGLALALGVSYKEGIAAKENYFKAIPGVGKLVRDTKAFIAKNGYVRTELGFVRHYSFTDAKGQPLDPKHTEALLMSGFNTRIQGTAAGLNKLALVKTHRALKKEFGTRARLLSTIHDETNIEFAQDIPVGTACAFLNDVMPIHAGFKPGWLDFPIETEAGPSFGELTKVPPELYGTLKTLADLQTYAASRPKKEEPTPAARAQAGDFRATRRAVPLRAPAILLDLPAGADAHTLDRLREVLDTHAGAYSVFLRCGDAAFLCRDLAVNPSPAFHALITALGLRLEICRPTEPRLFDPATLSF